MNRHLEWEGCFNTRDLGGLPAAGGRFTAPGAVVRTDAVERLTEKGWLQLWEYGVRTVVDLRNPDEYGADAAPRPPGLTTLALPLAPPQDGGAPAGLWSTGIQGTPLHYPQLLAQFPQRTARVVRALALAEPGGVAVHCVAGRDRTGLVSLLLLALAGVPAAAIAADYELSAERLPGLFAAVGEPDRRAELEAPLRRAGTTAAAAVVAAVTSLDPVEHLRAGGLSNAEIQAARSRLTTGRLP